MLEKRGDILYVGIDESNHGRFPEIFVAVASFNYQDSKVHKNSKKIRRLQRLTSSLKIRDYRYTIVSKEQYEKYTPKNIMPLVSSKLINSFDINYDFLKCYIDGEVKSDQRKLLEGLIKNQDDLDLKSLMIQEVPKRKQKQTNYIISLADGWANWIAKKTIKQEMTDGMRKRKINFI